jgi:hypothetical protein
MNYINLVKNGCHWLPQNPNCYFFMAKNWSWNARHSRSGAAGRRQNVRGSKKIWRVLERMMATKWAENMVYHAGWWVGTFFIFPNSWDDDPI